MMNFIKKGNGEPLILIHGVWMSSKFFIKNIDELSQHFTVYAIDLPGHGDSQFQEGGHTIEHYAYDLSLFIKKHKLKNIHLLGWSMGAFVIWDYLKSFGTELIKSNIIVSQGPTDFKWPDWEQGAFTLNDLIHMFRAVQGSPKALFESFLPNMFKESIDQSQLQWMLFENLKLSSNTAAAILIDQSTRDYREFIKTINTPTLLLWGRDEKCISLKDATYLNQNIKNSTLEIFENSGHCPFLEEPQRFNQSIIEFIDKMR